MPEVSVVMSVFKEPYEWLQKSIESILNQTYKDFEFIIIDDNPDNYQLRSYLDKIAKSDDRVVIIINEVNIGLTRSLNKGLALAKGKYIARMDADDISMPDRLEKQVAILSFNEVIDLCHTNYCTIDEYDNVTKHFYLSEERVKREWLVWTNNVAHSTVMFRSKLLELRTPLYNEERRSAQDYDLWTFFSLNGVEFSFINEELLQYRISAGQVSKVNNSQQRDNYYDIRRKYIVSRLKDEQIIGDNEHVSAETLIEKIRNSNYNPQTDSKNKELRLILYRLYYTCAGSNRSYVWKYFTDKRRISFYFSARMNFYVLSQLLLRNHWPAYLY